MTMVRRHERLHIIPPSYVDRLNRTSKRGPNARGHLDTHQVTAHFVHLVRRPDRRNDWWAQWSARAWDYATNHRAHR